MAQTITEKTELMTKIQDLLKSNGKEEFLICIIHNEETGGNTAETMVGTNTSCQSLSHIQELVEDIFLAKLITTTVYSFNEIVGVPKEKPTA